MDEESLVRIAPDLLLAGWGRVAHSAEPLGGGMNSATALVELTDGPVVAKWVPKSSAAALAAGCEIAQQLASYGLVTGAHLQSAGPADGAADNNQLLTVAVLEDHSSPLLQ